MQWSEEAEVDAILALLRVQWLDEARAGGPRTLRSILYRLSSMTVGEREGLVSLYEANESSSSKSQRAADQAVQVLRKVSVSSSLTEQIFNECFNQSLEKLALPSSLQTLTFGEKYNQTLQKTSLPSSLKDLTFGKEFNQSMEKVNLPSCLQNLSFGNNFNQSMQKVALPSSLQNLTFGLEFNTSMEKVALPRSLHNLAFGRQFNQNMEKVALPSSLESLTFGLEFNQNMEKVALPSSLQNLTFGARYNQSLDRVALPDSLQTLTFGREFNQSMEKVNLPSGLQNLVFGDNFNQSMEKVTLPTSLQILTFGSNFNQSMEKVDLPSCLQNLKFGWQFNQSMEKVALPSSLHNLTFGPEFNQSMQKATLPSSLQNLTCGSEFTQSMETFPLRLQNLTVRGIAPGNDDSLCSSSLGEPLQETYKADLPAQLSACVPQASQFVTDAAKTLFKDGFGSLVQGGWTCQGKLLQRRLQKQTNWNWTFEQLATVCTSSSARDNGLDIEDLSMSSGSGFCLYVKLAAMKGWGSFVSPRNFDEETKTNLEANCLSWGVEDKVTCNYDLALFLFDPERNPSKSYLPAWARLGDMYHFIEELVDTNKIGRKKDGQRQCLVPFRDSDDYQKLQDAATCCEEDWQDLKRHLVEEICAEQCRGNDLILLQTLYQRLQNKRGYKLRPEQFGYSKLIKLLRDDRFSDILTVVTDGTKAFIRAPESSREKCMSSRCITPYVTSDTNPELK